MKNGFAYEKGTPGLAVIARERSKSKTTVKYSINDAVLVPFRFIGFFPLTVSDIYGLHLIPLVNSKNNKGYDLYYRNRC